MLPQLCICRYSLSFKKDVKQTIRLLRTPKRIPFQKKNKNESRISKRESEKKVLIFRHFKHLQSKSFWISMENRRIFLDKIAEKCNIKDPSDWGKVKIGYIYQLGGLTLLKNYYNDSIFSCLQSIYTETQWKREWFQNRPNSYWKSMDNCKKFMDEIALKYNIKKPSDWGKIKIMHIRDAGGGSLLKNYYNDSLFECLQSVYKEIKWKREWFSNLPKFPKSYWESLENCRRFMDEIAMNSNIGNLNNWNKVTLAFISKRGGSGLLNKYEGSVNLILKSIYEGDGWNEVKDLGNKNPSAEMVFKFKQYEKLIEIEIERITGKSISE